MEVGGGSTVPYKSKNLAPARTTIPIDCSVSAQGSRGLVLNATNWGSGKKDREHADQESWAAPLNLCLSEHNFCDLYHSAPIQISFVSFICFFFFFFFFWFKLGCTLQHAGS